MQQEHHGPRHAAPSARRSRGPMVAGIVVVVVIALGAAWWLMGHPGLAVGGSASSPATTSSSAVTSAASTTVQATSSLAQTTQPAPGVTEVQMKATAEALARTWFSMWSFDNGTYTQASSSTTAACLPYLEPKSAAYEAFASADGGPSTVATPQVASCFVSATTQVTGERTVSLTVSYYGTQNRVSQESWDRIVAAGPRESSYVLTFADDGLISDVVAA